MAAKKTRKRAYIPPSSEVVNKRERTETTRTHRSSAPRPQPRGGARGAYAYPVPSMSRTLKRLPIYFLMILALQYYLNPQRLDGADRWIASGIAAGVVTLIFAPFMHMMDRIAYNRYQKKHGGGEAAKPKSDS